MEWENEELVGSQVQMRTMVHYGNGAYRFLAMGEGHGEQRGPAVKEKLWGIAECPQNREGGAQIACWVEG